MIKEFKELGNQVIQEFKNSGILQSPNPLIP
jgi:hypothetical protein